MLLSVVNTEGSQQILLEVRKETLRAAELQSAVQRMELAWAVLEEEGETEEDFSAFLQRELKGMGFEVEVFRDFCPYHSMLWTGAAAGG